MTSNLEQKYVMIEPNSANLRKFIYAKGKGTVFAHSKVDFSN
jgi:hypothetical protein